MIFQINIDLEIADKDVHAVFDFETGLIGFNEVKSGEEIEYNFRGSPVEYRVALVHKLEPFSASDKRMNFKISRKN